MATVEGAKEGKTRRNSSDHLSFQDIVPSSGWSEDEKCHYLLVDLPGIEFSSSYMHFSVVLSLIYGLISLYI